MRPLLAACFMPLRIRRKESGVSLSSFGENGRRKRLAGAFIKPASHVTGRVTIVAGQADVSVDQPKRAFDGAVRAAFGAIHPGLPGAADNPDARVSARRQIIGAPLVPGEHEAFQSYAELLRGGTSSLQVGAKLVGGLARRETVWVPTS